MNARIRRLVEPEFDAAFYKRTYGGTAKFRDPLEHFLVIGWAQGRDPSPRFSVFDYLLRNDDVLRRRINPLIHFLTVGKQDGRLASGHSSDQGHFLPSDAKVLDLLPLWFDETYYLDMNPDLAGAPNLLAQFLVLGWVEGRDPCAKFSTHKYLWKYADVWLSGTNPLLHFLEDGQAEGREAIPAEGSRYKLHRQLSEPEWQKLIESYFDTEFYARMYPSLAGEPDLFRHYRNVGWLEGRDPNENFSVRDYIAFHKDVQDSGVEPLTHYVRYGISEGRKTFPSKARPVQDIVAPVERTDEDEKLRAAFDEDFYRASYPELATIEDAFTHFMTIGWKEGRNPSLDFTTKYYLRNEGDIREAGINPFRHFILHGRREGRRGTHRIPRPIDMVDYPRVSVIVPNYNHARFLPERLASIVRQNYPNLELLIMDDCSIDDSREVIRQFAETYAGDCRLILNDVNSGNVFSQWEKGLSLATGELIWICESDDTCDDRFLEQTVYLFQDQSLKLVFGDIQFIDAEGNIQEGMSSLREAAEPGIWKEVNIMPAAKWFSGPLAVRNLMANVGGVVFRKPHISRDIWASLREFRVAGDWYLYLMMAGGGQIGYAPDAKAYFRQHGKNTSVLAFDRVSFYEELGRFHTLLRERWSVPAKITLAFYNNLLETFQNSKLASTHAIADIVSLDRLLQVIPFRAHVAVSFLNFNIGGGEIFPVELLNVLHQRGIMVSAVVQTRASDNSFVRNWLHPDIPVYSVEEISLTGPELARDAQFAVIHSHNIWSEFYFFKHALDPSIRYVATLHGSYEVSHVQPAQISRFFDKVEWVYLADRNIDFFRKSGFDVAKFRRIPNGFTRRLSAQPVTRADFGISAESVVFLFAARSHPEKGWMEAAHAFDRLVEATGQDLTLLMGGEGPEAERVRQHFGHNPRIKLIGFRSDVDDLLEISDFLVLPTRFAGESMPLTLIQAVLARVPIISTNVGQIADMLVTEAGAIGVALEPVAEDGAFIEQLCAAMQQAASGDLPVSAEAFAILARRFSMEVCADSYLEVYGLIPEGKKECSFLKKRTKKLLSLV